MGCAAGGGGGTGGKTSPAGGLAAGGLPSEGGAGTCANALLPQRKAALAPRKVRNPGPEGKRPIPEQHRQTGSIVKPVVL